MAIYPKLPDQFAFRLQALILAAEGEGKKWLDSIECPYSDTEKQYLIKLLDFEPRIADVESDFDGDKYDNILQEVERTIRAMQSLENDMVGAETGERVQVLKAKTALLEKWVNLKERIFNLKEVSEFQSVILTVLEEVCDVDQRNLVMERLAHLSSVEDVRASKT